MHAASIPVLLVWSLLTVAFLFGLMFLARILAIPFDGRILAQISKHRVLHSIWACFGIYSLCWLYLYVHPFAWPPRWLERRRQRAIVLERVQRAGGWQALRRDCIALVGTNELVQWHRGRSNGILLPPSIAALEPRRVDFISPHFESSQWLNDPTPRVRIQVFGLHATGARGIAYFALEVIPALTFEDSQFKPAPVVSGNRAFRYRKVTEGVYEVF